MRHSVGSVMRRDTTQSSMLMAAVRKCAGRDAIRETFRGDGVIALFLVVM